MSMSVGACSHAHTPKAQQTDSTDASDGVAAPDMMSELMQATSGTSSTSGQTGSSTDTSATGAPVPAFSTDTMSTLLALQDQSGGAKSVDHSGEQFFSVPDPSVAPALPDSSGGLKDPMSLSLMPQLG